MKKVPEKKPLETSLKRYDWTKAQRGRYAARFSVRAHDVTVDASLLWVGGGLALAVAVVLAFVPRLPSSRERRPGQRRRASTARSGRSLHMGRSNA